MFFRFFCDIIDLKVTPDISTADVAMSVAGQPSLQLPPEGTVANFLPICPHHQTTPPSYCQHHPPQGSPVGGGDPSVRGTTPQRKATLSTPLTCGGTSLLAGAGNGSREWSGVLSCGSPVMTSRRCGCWMAGRWSPKRTYQPTWASPVTGSAGCEGCQGGCLASQPGGKLPGWALQVYQENMVGNSHVMGKPHCCWRCRAYRLSHLQPPCFHAGQAGGGDCYC